MSGWTEAILGNTKKKPGTKTTTAKTTTVKFGFQ